MKMDKTVKKETAVIIIGTLILGAVMVAVFALLGKYDYTVLTGTALGSFAAVLNFFLMALTVQKAVGCDEAEAKKKIQISYTVRSIALLAVLGVGVYLPYFHWLPVVVSSLFPRITILFRTAMLKKKNGTSNGGEA